MGSLRIIFVLGLLACAALGAGEEIGLPPLAEVAERDPGMDRWQVTGSLPGAMPVARRDFGLCLDRQGWSRKSTTVTGRPGAVLSLTVWTKGERRLLLMLWEKELGKTRFSLGEESRNENKRKDK